MGHKTPTIILENNCLYRIRKILNRLLESRLNIIGYHNLKKDGSRQISGKYNLTSKILGEIWQRVTLHADAKLQDNKQIIEGHLNVEAKYLGTGSAQATISRSTEETENVYQLEFSTSDGSEYSTEHSMPKE